MRIADAKTLGSAIRTVRRSLGVTQAQLALTSGTNRRFVVELEQGKATTQLGKVLSVLATLGIAVDLIVPASAEPSTTAKQAAKQVTRGAKA